MKMGSMRFLLTLTKDVSFSNSILILATVLSSLEMVSRTLGKFPEQILERISRPVFSYSTEMKLLVFLLIISQTLSLSEAYSSGYPMTEM
jgi:hypothetical protein